MKKLIIAASVLALTTAAQAQGPGSGPKKADLCPIFFPGLHWVIMYVPCQAADPNNGGGWGGLVPR